MFNRRKLLVTALVLTGLAISGMLAAPLAWAAGCGYGQCYQTYYQPYYQPSYYYPERYITYVNSVQLYQPFEFRFVPPTALLQLYGTPQVTTTTTTTTTTTQATAGQAQTVQVVGGGGVQAVVGGVSTVVPGQPQAISDGLPIAQDDTQAPAVQTQQPRQNTMASASGAAGVLRQYCASCHRGSGGKGGVMLLDANGNIKLQRNGQPLSWMTVLASVEGHSDYPMPPGSNSNPSKKVPPAQRKLLWGAAQNRH